MTVSTMLSLLAQGFVTSLSIFVLTLLGSLPLGLAVMFGRRSRFAPLRWFVKAYISIMRGTPLMLQLMVVFYGPKLLLGVTVPGNWRFTAVIVAFVINYAAYFAEIYRGGLESIPRGQFEAAEVLGYTKGQTFFRIILPQMVKRVIPSVTNEVITLGTLMAVYLATSDEAIPLLVSMPAYWDKLAVLMVIKVLYAIVVGFVLDFVLRGVLPKGLRGGYTGHADEVDCHEEHSDAEGNEKPIWQAALRHTLEIFVFIFVFSLVFGMIVEGVGEDVFAEVLGGMGFFQPVVAALVGLIPNCAASVLLTQLYVEGALRFSSLVAGLCTGAGVGLAVLWRANPSWKQNLFITGLTWAAGAFVGVAMQVVVAVFA